jgi:hypothetical protein
MTEVTFCSHETPQPASEDRRVLISSTPVILSYFAEKKEGTRNDITTAVFKMASELSKTNMFIDAIFRGNLSNPKKGSISSETVDNELWFWLSNDFLEEAFSKEHNDIFYKINSEKSFENYELENLSKWLKVIKWNNPKEKEHFLKILRKVIDKSK